MARLFFFFATAFLPSTVIAQPLRLIFGSCIDEPSSPLWKSIAELKPDAMVLLGDTIYLRPEELGRKELIAARYARLTSTSEFRTLRESIPVFAVWDDHDLGPDNADSSFTHGEVSKAAFRATWRDNPSPPEGLEATVAFERRFPQAHLLALDSRTFRRNFHGVLYGEAQLKWIERVLSKPGAPIVILASGTPWLVRAAPSVPSGIDTLNQFPEEERRIFKAIEESPAKIVLLSGDRHLAEVLIREIGTKTVMEMSVSPLTAEPAPASDLLPDLYMVLAHTGWKTFGVLTIDPESVNPILGAVYTDSGVKLSETPAP